MVQELAIEIENLKAFVSDGASVMTSAKGGVAAKRRKDFASAIINMHYTCYQLALIYA